jgi:endonuclease/exonuclease/phosphatase family metal-dependent hydrolase
MEQELKIITFNVWDLPLWFNKDRRERIEKIAQYLLGENADVISLQECWDLRNRRLLREILGSVYHFSSERKGLKGNWLKKFSNSVGGLMTFSKFPISEENFFPFGRINYSFTEIFGNKGFLETILETPWGKICVINTHMQFSKISWGRRFRLAQIRAVMDHAREIKMPIILNGDFNQHNILNQPSFNQVIQDHRFGCSATDQPTYRRENPLCNHWPNRLKFSHRLDYIFTRELEKLGLIPKRNQPIVLDPPLSDHDPVELILSVEKIKEAN